MYVDEAAKTSEYGNEYISQSSPYMPEATNRPHVWSGGLEEAKREKNEMKERERQKEKSLYRKKRDNREKKKREEMKKIA